MLYFGDCSVGVQKGRVTWPPDCWLRVKSQCVAFSGGAFSGSLCISFPTQKIFWEMTWVAYVTCAHPFFTLFDRNSSTFVHFSEILFGQFPLLRWFRHHLLRSTCLLYLYTHSIISGSSQSLLSQGACDRGLLRGSSAIHFFHIIITAEALI